MVSATCDWFCTDGSQSCSIAGGHLHNSFLLRYSRCAAHPRCDLEGISGGDHLLSQARLQETRKLTGLLVGLNVVFCDVCYLEAYCGNVAIQCLENP